MNHDKSRLEISEKKFGRDLDNRMKDVDGWEKGNWGNEGERRENNGGDRAR